MNKFKIETLTEIMSIDELEQYAARLSARIEANEAENISVSHMERFELQTVELALASKQLDKFDAPDSLKRPVRHKLSSKINT